MAQKPSIPKGTRDFSPLEMMRRTYMFDTIRRVFRTYGYAPLETPAMENLSTLTGKYGEEGDKLLFKILNSGDFTRGFTPDDAKVIAAGTGDGRRTAQCHGRADMRKGAPLRPDGSLRPLCGSAPGRNNIPVPALSGTAGMACRPATEGALPGVLPMRRGRHRDTEPCCVNSNSSR